MKFLKHLGPGILFASTAIGVSHLVQSTRAGALFGFGLLWAIILANFFKFPFFEYGSRYANVTGVSLIDGYFDMSRWVGLTYTFLTVASMFFVTAAVCSVGAGFMMNILPIDNVDPLLSTGALMLICILILIAGKYKLLDSLIKIVALILLITTIIATVVAVGNLQIPTDPYNPIDFVDGNELAFLIALMGWMPTAVDLSTWNSLWTVEKIKSSRVLPSLKETLLEFNIGYWGSAALSLCFLLLGLYLLYPAQDAALPSSSVGFAHMVVTIYTDTLGKWSYWLIAVAGFAIMFGTAIGVMDGYTRAVDRCLEKAFRISDFPGVVVLIVLFGGSLGTIWATMGDPTGFKKLVDIATTISFLIAPIIAVLNFYLVVNPTFPKAGRPSLFLKIWSVAGIVFLTGFSLYFLYISMQY